MLRKMDGSSTKLAPERTSTACCIVRGEPATVTASTFIQRRENLKRMPVTFVSRLTTATIDEASDCSAPE